MRKELLSVMGAVAALLGATAGQTQPPNQLAPVYQQAELLASTQIDPQEPTVAQVVLTPADTVGIAQDPNHTSHASHTSHDSHSSHASSSY
jgi:hypothetical protein